MKKKQQTAFLILLLLLSLTASALVLAQTSAGFNLQRHVIAGGGGVSSSAHYNVDGTMGQALSGPPSAVSSSYEVRSGYWVGGAEQGTAVYLPAISKQ